MARERAEKYLKQLQLWDKRDKMSRGLSGGMKRRLMIARALMHEPRLLILDEPTAGVDIEIRRSMWDFLREINERGTTIILTTHYLEEAETLCRNIAIIDGGRIVERDRMSSLLRRLQHRDVRAQPARRHLARAPSWTATGATLIDDHTLEVEIAKEQNLNDLFARLSQLGIEVLSMRNKVNRLEEIFMRLVEGKAAAAQRRATAAWRPSLMSSVAAGRRPPSTWARPLDRLQDHRHPRVRPHHPHLGPDHRALGGDGDAVLRHLRQPDRPAASARWAASTTCSTSRPA